KRGVADGAWHGMVERALAAEAEEVRDAAGVLTASRWRLPRPPRLVTTATPAASLATTFDAPPTAAEAEPLPAWIAAPVAPLVPTPRLPPPAALADEEEEAAATPARLADPAARLRGTLVHRLIEALAGAAAADDRPGLAARFLAREAADLPAE